MVRIVPLLLVLFTSGASLAGPVPPAQPAPVPHSRPTQLTRTAQPATPDGSASTATGAAHGRDADRLVDSWPERSREIALRFIAEYGLPEESTASTLIWHGNGPWKRTVVYREGAEHAFPHPHLDHVEQSVVYQVPADRFDDLAWFDGSLQASRTRGELSSRCDSEAANFLAINLAVQVADDRIDAPAARALLAERMRMLREGVLPKESKVLLFQQPRRAGDPDEMVMQPQVTGL